MVRRVRRLWLLGVLVLGAACAANAGAAGGTRPASRAELITYEEIRQRGPFSDLFDLVQTLRPRWMRAQGPDTLTGDQGQVRVVMNGNRLGPVSTLRGISPTSVTSIRWISPLDAAGKYGLDHGHGAIEISTAPVE